MDPSDKAPKEMMTSTPSFQGIPVYEDATMPHRDSETKEDIHCRCLNVPGMGEMVLCSPEFMIQLKERYGGGKE